MTELIKVEEVRHSKLGASGAHRWMNCAGSLALIEKLMDGMDELERAAFTRGGAAASEGTAAHELSAKAVLEERDAWEYIGTKIIADGREFIVDQEMADGAQLHIDTVRDLFERHAEEGARLYVEHSLASCLDPDAFGTSDIIIFVPGVKIIVIDFKYGYVTVEPDSSQNKYYGALACEEFEADGIEEVELYITQPRVPHPKGRARKHTITKTELEDWFAEEVLPAMAATREKDAPLTIGEWCRFCPARDKCPALRSETMAFDMSLEPEYMTGDEIGKLLQRGKAIAKYMEKLEQEAFARARKGEKVDGFKLVKKKANRVWKREISVKGPNEEINIIKLEDAVKQKFGNDAYSEPKLLGPPGIEKLTGGKTFVARWAYTPDSGLTMAPSSDKRNEIELTGDAMFDGVDA